MTEWMAQRSLRQKPRISYYEPEEPALDEYVFCEKCGDYVYEYCSTHGPLLVIPDDKVPAKPNVPSYVPRAALTIPHVFLHITYSIIPDAGLGVFSSMALPSGVRFGPYRGLRTDVVDSSYCWQIYDKNRKPIHCVDAADANKSNWMRYVNCARHWKEQNLVAYQYRGELYYRTIKIIPRFTELMVFYGSEFACELDVDLGKYNSPPGYAQKFGAPVAKKQKSSENSEIITEDKETLHFQKTENHNRPNDITTDITVLGQVTLPIVSKQVESINDPIQNIKTNKVNKKTTKQRGVKSNTDVKNQKSIKPTTQNNVQEIKEVQTIEETTHTKLCIKDFYLYCDECNKRCVSKLELQNHLRLHDTNRAYDCEICKKAYTQISSLKIHMRTHTGEKPYVCEICKKTFTQMSDLKVHMRTHTGEKPYICEICKKAFNRISSLKIHMRTHTGEKSYVCEICKKTFTQMSDLKVHMRTHTGEKPYICEICKKAFNRISSLKIHMRTHTGEKPYVCEICDAKFTYRFFLKNHLLKIHLSK